MAQILKVMLWKTYILRKRRWFITLLEFAVPILMFGLLIYFNGLYGSDNTTTILNNQNIMEYDKIASYGYLTSYKIAYSPSNNVTDTIMSEVFATLTANNVTGMLGGFLQSSLYIKYSYLFLLLLCITIYIV